MTIRKFKPQDKQAFIAMCKDFYTGGAALHPIPEQQMEQTFDYVLNDSQYVKGFIFDEDGEAAGYGLAFIYYSNEVGGLCAFLDEIYVSPNYRGAGFGADYLNDIAKIIGDNIKGLRLEVCHTNTRAIKLYEKMGFKHLDYMQLVKTLD